MTQSAHRGIAEDDGRNRQVIAHFRPPEITEAYIRARLARVNRHRSAAEIELRVKKLVADLETKPHRPDPPLSQSAQAADPVSERGTHPDLVTELWRLDSGLPASCRWLLWGYPALVHPRSGVIFAVAFGSIGIVLRLPPHLRTDAAMIRATNPGQHYDIAPAGPGWRFLLPGDSAATYCASAYEFAGDAATDFLDSNV